MARPDSGLNISGIYKITSKVHPERVYIGSAVNLRHRKNIHFGSLDRKTHKNPKLQMHYNKYGKEDLSFSIIVICNKRDLIPENGIVWLEQFFLDVYKPWFNIARTAGSSLGIKRSQEFKDKVRRMNYSRSEEMRRNFSLINIGRTPWNKGLKFDKQSPELIEKRTAPLRGRKRPPFSWEWRDNLSKSHIGHKQSKETLRKRSEAMKRKPPVSDETRKKLSIANTGKKKPPITKEARMRHSVIMKKWWDKRKEKQIKIVA